MITNNGTSFKIYSGNKKVRYVYLGNEKLWSSGTLCTYIANGESYTFEYESGTDCVTNISFTPNRQGFIFMGWTDNKLSLKPLSTYIVEDNPITLYALWSRNDESFTSYYGTYNNTQFTTGGYNDDEDESHSGSWSLANWNDNAKAWKYVKVYGTFSALCTFGDATLSIPTLNINLDRQSTNGSFLAKTTSDSISAYWYWHSTTTNPQYRAAISAQITNIVLSDNGEITSVG